MNVVLPIPDDLATRLSGGEPDLARQALEGLAAEAYRAGRLTRTELRRLLGFATQSEVDGFLKQRGIDDGQTREEFAREGSQATSEDERQAAAELVGRFQAFRAGKTLGDLSLKELIAEGRR
jgi:hypothetical protein